jgi:hypothetical protein
MTLGRFLALTIVIDRVNGGSQRYGILRARVKQGSRFGSNLLSDRSLTNIEKAKQAIQPAFPGCKITWEVVAQ